MNIVPYFLPVAAYLYGSIPFGFLFAKVLRGRDIREIGSGNVGATNAARVLGFRYFPLVFLLDFSKGAMSAYLGGYFAGFTTAYEPGILAVLCAVAAILGHVFPLYLKFKGGKAVAAGTGACVVLAPWSVLIAAACWTVVFTVFRYVSLASITAAAVLVISSWALYPQPLGPGIFRTLFCTIAGIFVVILHHENIHRLINGTENKVSYRPGEKSGKNAGSETNGQNSE